MLLSSFIHITHMFQARNNHIIITLNPKVADYYHFQSSVCVKHLGHQFRFLINIVHFRRSLQKQIFSQILCPQLHTSTKVIQELGQKSESHRAKRVPCALSLCQQQKKLLFNQQGRLIGLISTKHNLQNVYLVFGWLVVVSLGSSYLTLVQFHVIRWLENVQI